MKDRRIQCGTIFWWHPHWQRRQSCSWRLLIESVDQNHRRQNHCHRGKPQVDDDTGLVSYKNAETGRVEQINRDQVKSMDELDN
jgi:hypothetical protein